MKKIEYVAPEMEEIKLMHSDTAPDTGDAEGL